MQVQSRLGAVMGNSHYREGWHNTATLGTFGATAAAARLLGMNEEALCRAFGFAATLTGGLRSVFGSPAKPLRAGRDTTNEENLSGSALVDPDVVAWRDRVHVHGDAEVPRANARVTIDDGKDRVTHTHDASQPQADLKQQRRRLLDKSSALLRPRYGERAVARMQARLLDIAQQPSLTDWLHDTVLELDK